MAKTKIADEVYKVRVDKWLWAVRIFKSRTKASDACRTSRVRLGELIVKPSTQIQVDDLLEIRKEGFVLQFLVKKLIGKRVSAELAAPCYENLTPEDELNKFKSWFVGKGPSERRDKGAGRPTKRERRDIDGFKIEGLKDEIYLDDWFESDKED